MGQYWNFVNIDRMESWEGGKMGELMYDIRPALLSYLVRVDPHPTREDEAVGRWAGDRIIYLGDGAIDLPPGVITEDNQSLVEKLLERDNSEQYEDEYDGPMLGQRLYYKATPISDELTNYNWWGPATDICRQNSVWALRSLSKNEFILSDKAISGSELERDSEGFYNTFKFTDFPGLFQVLIFRTGWSANDNCAAEYNGVGYRPAYGQKILMNEGTWAGDRIDMVVVTDDGVELEKDGWRDVSYDACTQMKDIFHAEDCIF